MISLIYCSLLANNVQIPFETSYVRLSLPRPGGVGCVFIFRSGLENGQFRESAALQTSSTCCLKSTTGHPLAFRHKPAVISLHCLIFAPGRSWYHLLILPFNAMPSCFSSKFRRKKEVYKELRARQTTIWHLSELLFHRGLIAHCWEIILHLRHFPDGVRSEVPFKKPL